MEDKKPALPVPMTAQLIQLRINTEITKNKLTISDLNSKALTLVKNEDNLTEMKGLLADLDKVDDFAEEVFKREKKPYLEGGRACDAGKKLVLTETARIRGMVKPDYDKLLKDIAERKRLQDLKVVQDAEIKKTIERNVINFSNRIVAAITKKELSDVEFLINREKSPAQAKSYGEFHQLAITRYDEVLRPVIKDQKLKVEKLDGLNSELLAAEASNDPEKMDALNEQINSVSNEMLQNHAMVAEAALNQDFFATTHVVEVLPAFRDKRTNYSMEIADVEVAFKKARHLLEFSVDKDAAKPVLDDLKKTGAFENKDEVIIDGIKYIATKIREAL